MSKNLTLEERATNYDTMLHIHKVGHYINIIIKELMDRAEKHDASKLESPEVEAFTKQNHKLNMLGYNSEEYKKSLEDLGTALEHHYANNSHHPQFFPNGIKGMNLVDVIEMFCDWKAATLRHNAGNILKSIEDNKDRYNMSEELCQIFRNTLRLLE